MALCYTTSTNSSVTNIPKILCTSGSMVSYYVINYTMSDPSSDSVLFEKDFSFPITASYLLPYSLPHRFLLALYITSLRSACVYISSLAHFNPRTNMSDLPRPYAHNYAYYCIFKHHVAQNPENLVFK